MARDAGFTGDPGLAFTAAVARLETSLDPVQKVGTGLMPLAVLIYRLWRTTENTGAAAIAVFIHPGIRTRPRSQLQAGHHAPRRERQRTDLDGGAGGARRPDGARRLADEAAERARGRLAEIDADTSVLRGIVDDLAVRTA